MSKIPASMWWAARSVSRLFTFACLPVVSCLLILPVAAQAPDLTSGGVPTSDKYWNLGPTGMKGWFHHVGAGTGISRQILVTTVEAGSPADGVLAVNDVILGVDGTGADPVEFTSDARRSLAQAIADAEASTPATLKLLRWRAGLTSLVSIDLETLGAYSATAPYNCPKSAAILQKGLDAVMAGGGTDQYKFSSLALLAGSDPANPAHAARLARAQQEAHALILTPAQVEEYTSGKILSLGKTAWSVGFQLVTQAEYYLQTGDAAVLESIRARAVAYANGQSMFGTGGHQFSKPGPNGEVNGPYGIGYGVVNSANMQCFYGLILARECGITDPEIAPAIERALKFYGGYVNRGSIPYGEHQPGGGHESNGKCGIAALAFRLEGSRPDAADFYAKMAAASSTNRDAGHTGPYLNYLWAPLGANVGGEEAMAAYFSQASWTYDLARRWNGGFEYNSYGQGNNGGDSWSANFQMSTAALLTYALPLRKLYITGKNQDPQEWFDAAEVETTVFAASYNAAGRTTTELIADLGSWSPPVRRTAAAQIGLRTAEHAALLPTLHSMATDTQGNLYSRIGACFALGTILDPSSVSLLAGLLTDDENLVRWASAQVLPNFPQAAKMAEINTMLAACASTGRPVLPLDEHDPIHLAHANLVQLIFHNGGAGGPRGVLYNHNLVGIDRELLYPAIRAAARTPIGGARSSVAVIYPFLTRADVEAVSGAIIDATMVEAQADRMFALSVRNNGAVVLQDHNFSEGVPLGVLVAKESNPGIGLGVLENYAGSSLMVQPNPQVIEYCEMLIASGSNVPGAQAVLDAIAADQLPDEPTPFKHIEWIFPDKPSLTLPENWTVLRADAFDHAAGDSVFTWRKAHGAGKVTFSPNGTAAAENTTVTFDGTPGRYLFEVTMSDSRGLTEVSKTVAVTLNDTSGTLPANSAPTADSQWITAGQGTPTPIILTGNDPEGFDPTYEVLSQPTHGVLSGSAPHLVYVANANYTGADAFTFQITDSEGQSATATIDITVDPVGAVGLAVYEPFKYPAGNFNNSSGPNEVGFLGSWSANTSIKLVAGSLGYGTLLTDGGSIGNLASGSTFGGSRTVSSAALAGNGLLDDGATLWFSMMVGPGPVNHGTNLHVALANNSFSTSNNTYWINNDGAQPGSGIGISLLSSSVAATHFRDSSQGTGASGHVYGNFNGANGMVLTNQARLVVGEITWGAASDTIRVYLPSADMSLPSTPTSTLTVDVDQSTFDTLTFARTGAPVLDEIRFGSTYQSVLQGTVPMVRDINPPTPDPMSFAVAPAPASPSSITMKATTAFDPLGVEYYFTCTAGGGDDSGWQNSNVYTAAGLTPGVAYSYTVKARDMRPGLNETAPSPVASATIPAQGTVPAVVGMPQSAAASSITNAGFAVGTVATTTEYSLTVPAGHVLSQSPSGDSAGAYGLAVDLVISIGEDPDLPDLASADIVDNQGGGPVEINLPLTYTITFSQPIDPTTVDASDFTNAGNASIVMGAITEISPGIFTVEVTPSSTGLLRFAVAAGAVVTDTQGRSLNTTQAIIDDTTLVVNLPPVTVPNVAGLSQASAETNLVAANLTVGTVHQIYSGTVAPGIVISHNPAAGASVPGQSPVSLAVSLGAPPDTTPPVIASLNPFDGENNVEVYDHLTAYFDENVLLGSGNIVIRNLSDFTETIIPVTDNSQVFISGVVMTIVPTDGFLAGKSYAVRIAPGAVVDLSGNTFGGINDNATWNFSTAVTSHETILFNENFEAPDVAGYAQGTTPANWVRAAQGFNSSWHGLIDKAGGDFSAADPNRQAYAFRYGNSGITTKEGVIATVTAGITYQVVFDVIRDRNNPNETPYQVQMIAYDPGASRNDCRTSSPGTLLAAQTGNATSNGSFSTVHMQFTVPAGSSSIGKDLAIRFIGASTSAIIDNVIVKTINPNPADEVPPVVTSYQPAPGSINFPEGDNLVVNFDENIIRGNGFITLKNLTDATETKINMLDGDRVIISGSTLTINPPEDLILDRFYAVRIPLNAIFDSAGNSYAGIHNDTLWSFSTGEINDPDAPTLVSVSPANGASNVSYSVNLSATFDESVVAGNGNITLKNLTDGTQSVISVIDESQIRISGPWMTIHPAAYLGEGKNYAVWIDPGAITDLSGNAHAGIENDSTWNFTTSAINPPAIVSLDPVDESVNIDPAYSLSVTFDEPVMAGTGNIIIRNVNDAIDLSISITDASQVSINGPVVTINPPANLLQGKNHAVLIDPGAIRDLDGNDFAGITNDGVWNFVTGVSTDGAVFSDDFEVASGSPDVDSTGSLGDTSKKTGPKWIRASNGFGSDRHGIVDESSGQFTDPTGEQAYAFRYTNSGITSKEGLIGALTSGATYSVSFYVVLDGHNSGNFYKAELVTFGAGALRNDIDANHSKVLAQATSSYNGTNYKLVTFEYTSNGVADAAVQGHDVALRFVGATTSANIDNVQVAVSGGGAGDTTPPTLASTDIVDDQGGVAVTADSLVTYTVTFSEDMDETTVGASDFGNAGTSALTIGTVTETAPGVFSVQATPTTDGTLQLRVNAGAVLTDLAGNALDTTTAIVDDTIISVTSGGGGNSAPVWTGDPVIEAIATQDIAYSGTLADDASDVDEDTLSFVKVGGPVWLNVASNGALTGTPGNADVGINHFIVSVSDGIAAPVETTLVIEVINVNDAPVASGGSISTDEDTAVAITLIASDIDGDTLTYSVVAQPANGTLSGTAPDLTYTPNANFNGSDSLTFVANDGTVDSNPANIVITVNPVNDAPVFNANPFSAPNAIQDEAYNASIAGSASDIDGDTLTFAKMSGPAWLGIATDGTLSGTPADTDVGLNTFTLSASDGIADAVQATLEITVDSAVVGTLVFADDFEPGANVFGGTTADVTSYTIGNTSRVANTALWVRASSGFGADRNGLIDESENGGANFTDPDGTQAYGFRYTNSGVTTAAGKIASLSPGMTIHVSFDAVRDGWNGGTAYDAMLVLFDPGATRSAIENAEKGTAAVLARSTGTVAADGNYHRISFSYTVGDNVVDNDGAGPNTATAFLTSLLNKDIALRFDGASNYANIDNVSVTIGTEFTNSAPVASDGSVTTDEDTAVAITLVASDIDGDALAYTVATQPTNGTLSGIAPNLTYTPNADYNGSDSFTFVANDGTLDSNIATVSITVNPVNDAPVFAADPFSAPDATEDEAYSASIAGAASDVDGDPLTYAKVSGPAWLAIAPDGALSGTPLTADIGTNSFIVSVSDGELAVEASLVINVVQALATVPNVVGFTQADAESAITAADLAVGIITEEHSDTVPAGDVISQGLAAGAIVPQGSELDLVVSLGAASSAKLVRTTISAVTNIGWTTVDLGSTYTSPVIVATPMYSNSTLPPVVTRIRNVTTTGFDLQVARADGHTGPVSFAVSIVAMEEGVYTQAADGVTMEAVKFTSTLTAHGPNNWNAEARSFQNSYTSPVVIGQVMSANDPNWSAFWSMGSSRSNPVDAANFNVGKHVGQDTNLIRANETIGYIVIEAGNGSIDGIAYEAGLGAKIVQSFGDSATPYTYPLSGNLNSIGSAAVSQSGMNGNDGSWAVLSGSPAITTTTLGLHVAEDAFKDSRRRHAAEYVGYIVFE